MKDKKTSAPMASSWALQSQELPFFRRKGAQSGHKGNFELGRCPRPRTRDIRHMLMNYAIIPCMKEECRYEGMTDEQIAAYELAMRRKATAAMPIEDLVATIRQTAYQLHLYLGTGYLEKVYENGLRHRLEKQGIRVRAQVPLTVKDEDGFVIGNYEADLIVDNRVIIELKHVATLIPQHEAQLINYLCTTGIEHGLLINFGSPKFEIAKRIYTKKPSGA